MKRYRVIALDFDTRAPMLEAIQDHWEQLVKEQVPANHQRIIAQLR